MTRRRRSLLLRDAVEGMTNGMRGCFGCNAIVAVMPSSQTAWFESAMWREKIVTKSCILHLLDVMTIN